VDLLWDIDEKYLEDIQQVQTTVRISCELIFQKKISLIQKKIKDYYD
jgi:hypothetical protein